MQLKKINYLLVLLLLSLLFSCSNQQFLTPLVPNYSQLSEKPVTIKVSLDSPPFVSGVNGELSGVAKSDDGKLVKYSTFNNGGKLSAITVTFSAKWVVIESHATTSAEADTILKLARQGGYAKEYKELSERYSTLGLLRK